MTSRYLLTPELSAFIRKLEQWFACSIGEPKAYFELMNGVRGVYQVAAFGYLLQDEEDSKPIEPMLFDVMRKMFETLMKQDARRIVFRNGWKVSLAIEHHCQHGGDVLMLHSRFVAFTDDWRTVSVPPVFHHDFGRLLSKSELEDGTVSLSPSPVSEYLK